MIRTTQEFSRWLQGYGINSEKITLILRCNDVGIESQVEMAIARDLQALAIHQTPAPNASLAVRDSLQINGIKCLLRNLDESR